MEKASEVSGEMVENEFEELGRSLADTLFGMPCSALLMLLDSGKTSVTRASSWVDYVGISVRSYPDNFYYAPCRA
jgi:hypothetical protein